MKIVHNAWIEPRDRGVLVSGIALFLTLISITGTYAWRWHPGTWLERLAAGSIFATGLLLVLGAHELGHMLAARRERLDVGWPLFIPFPWGLGTLGAFLRWRELPRSRASLARIAIAGPIFGFGMALLLWAVAYSQGILVGDLPVPWVFQWPGVPIAIGAEQPLVFAAWIGLLVTAANLCPVGHLDGGHLAWATFGEYFPWIQRGAILIALLLAIRWPGWLLWVAFAQLVGARPLPIRLSTQAPSVKWPLIQLFLFVVCFLPVPFI